MNQPGRTRFEYMLIFIGLLIRDHDWVHRVRYGGMKPPHDYPEYMLHSNLADANMKGEVLRILLRMKERVGSLVWEASASTGSKPGQSFILVTRRTCY